MTNTLQTAAIDDVVDDLMDDPNRARDIIQKLHTRLLADTANDVPADAKVKADGETARPAWFFPETDEFDDELFDNMPI